MGSVTERRGHTVDAKGFIHYDDVESTWERADAIAGHAVDRRRSYLIVKGRLRVLASWVSKCSGCDGNGCRECGFKGKRWHRWFGEYHDDRAPKGRK